MIMAAKPYTIEQARAWYKATNAAERKEVQEAKAAADATADAARRAADHRDLVNEYTTPALREMAAQDPHTGKGGRGSIRAAAALLEHPTLDTPSRRLRAVAIAHTGMNLGLWGIYSEAVASAAADLARMIATGNEDSEHYTERTARKDREAQQAEREARFTTAAALAFGR